MGSARVLHVNVRLIAATHRDLKRRVSEGEFRGDLYFRLRVVELTLPPLREREDDLLLLARGLPGVQARPDDDGEVRLDHIPPDVEARVIVYGLPPTAAQSDARTSRDGEFEVRVVPGAIVRGRVLGQELEPVPDALVWVGSGQPTRTDRDGRFELTHVLPGEQKITAQWRPRKRRSKPWLTSRQLSLQGGETYERVELLLDR